MASVLQLNLEPSCPPCTETAGERVTLRPAPLRSRGGQESLLVRGPTRGPRPHFKRGQQEGQIMLDIRLSSQPARAQSSGVRHRES